MKLHRGLSRRWYDATAEGGETTEKNTEETPVKQTEEPKVEGTKKVTQPTKKEEVKRTEQPTDNTSELALLRKEIEDLKKLNYETKRESILAKIDADVKKQIAEKEINLDALDNEALDTMVKVLAIAPVTKPAKDNKDVKHTVDVDDTISNTTSSYLENWKKKRKQGKK